MPNFQSAKNKTLETNFHPDKYGGINLIILMKFTKCNFVVAEEVNKISLLKGEGV